MSPKCGPRLHRTRYKIFPGQKKKDASMAYATVYKLPLNRLFECKLFGRSLRSKISEISVLTKSC